MRRFGMIGLLFVGFVAGTFYVYSCGGGSGSSSEAQLPASEIYSFYADMTPGELRDVLGLGASENFVVTDIVTEGEVSIRTSLNEIRYRVSEASPGFHSFSSGIRFYPGETIRIQNEDVSTNQVTITGYLN